MLSKKLPMKSKLKPKPKPANGSIKPPGGNMSFPGVPVKPPVRKRPVSTRPTIDRLKENVMPGNTSRPVRPTVPGRVKPVTSGGMKKRKQKLPMPGTPFSRPVRGIGQPKVPAALGRNTGKSTIEAARSIASKLKKHLRK